MKTIGLLGGMSWESTLEYYRLINQGVRARLGGHHSASITLHSVDFHAIEELQRRGDWATAGTRLAAAARKVQSGGGECVALCTNTMHKIAAEVVAAITIPFIHLVDTTADVIRRAGISQIGLLGTKFTMEQSFYKERLANHGISVVVPSSNEREAVNAVIYDELCKGIVSDQSRSTYLRIIDSLVADGAGGVIMGCTEIPLLVRPEDTEVTLFDTTQIHVDALIEWSLEGHLDGDEDDHS